MTQIAQGASTANSRTNFTNTSEIRERSPRIARLRGLRLISRLSVIAILSVMSGLTASAQNIQFTQGAVGSGLDNTLSVPLRSYPGRGAAGLPVNLHYSSKVWRIRYLHTPGYWDSGYYYCGNPVAETMFAEFSTAGWTSSLDVPELEWPQDNEVYNNNGKPFNPDCLTAGLYRIKRVYVHMPDGSVHELRDGDQPYTSSTVSHSGTFYAVDGSRMKYLSSDSTLWLPDGSHYVLGSSTTQFIDRNGNTLNYDNSSRVWTDTLGRSLANPLPANPTEESDASYVMPGFNGTNITYTLHWRHLSNALAPGVSGVLPMADEYLPYPSATPTVSTGDNPPTANTTPALFQSSEGGDTDTWTDVVGPGQERDANFDPIVLAGISLPNGLSYTFYYDQYAELTKTIYPTGAYDMVSFEAVAAIGDIKAPYSEANRGVTSRSLSADGTGGDVITWTYSVANSTVNQNQVITTTAPDGLVTESLRHDFTIPTYYSPSPHQYWPFGFENATDGQVYETRTYAPSSLGGAMLRRSLTEYVNSYATLSARLGSPYDQTVYAYRNSRPDKEVSLILDTGGNALAKTETFTYDTTYELTTGVDLTVSTESQFAAVTSVDPTSAAIGALPVGDTARSTQTIYYTADSAYRDRYILGVAIESVVKDGSGNPVSRTRTAYDELSSYPLVTYSDLGTSSYTDPGSSGTIAKRADATTIRRCQDVSSSCSTYLETHAQFDQTGNVVAVWNERGIETQTDYAINDGTGGNIYHHAYPTKVTTAAPDPSGTHGSNTGFISTSTYDPVTGLIKSTTDANGQTTTISYADDSSTLDPLLRSRKVTAPNGAWTKTSYHDAVGTPRTTSGLYVEIQTQMDGSRVTDSYQFFDALGRAVRSQTFEGSSGYLTVDTQFDTFGRAHQTSNPYTASALDGAVNPSGVWTTITGYDALSRVTQVTLPDSTTVGTAYSGIYTSVTDQAGRQRRQKVDALGHIVRVDEPDPAHGGALDGGSIDSPYLASYYSYDTLGNLVHIQQGTGTDLQNRFFKYDALGRLTYERQVEAAGTFSQTDALTGNSAWSRKLLYDESLDSVGYQGLLTTRCDARNVCAYSHYDQLNRPTGVTYSDSRMPAVTNNYDQADSGYFNKGKLTESITAAVADDTGTSWNDSIPETRLNYDFDLMGRTVTSTETVDSNAYKLEYTYNLGGQLTQEKYPSGRLVNVGYDEAGRLATVNSGTGHVYADAFIYAGHGALSGFTLGNGATVSLGYGTNGRLQLSDITLAKNGTTLQKYQYSYGQIVSGSVDATKNNGQ